MKRHFHKPRATGVVRETQRGILRIVEEQFVCECGGGETWRAS